MNEIETLKQTIAALENLIFIKDQTISSLQSRPYYQWQQYPYWQGITSVAQQAQAGGYQQNGTQQPSGIAQFATNTAGLCSVSGGQS